MPRTRCHRPGVEVDVGQCRRRDEGGRQRGRGCDWNVRKTEVGRMHRWMVDGGRWQG